MLSSNANETVESVSEAGYIAFDNLQVKNLLSQNQSVLVWASSDLTNSMQLIHNSSNVTSNSSLPLSANVSCNTALVILQTESGNHSKLIPCSKKKGSKMTSIFIPDLNKAVTSVKISHDFKGLAKAQLSKYEGLSLQSSVTKNLGKVGYEELLVDKIFKSEKDIDKFVLAYVVKELEDKYVPKAYGRPFVTYAARIKWAFWIVGVVLSAQLIVA